MKTRHVATVVTEFVVAVSMCAATWGLSSTSISQAAVNQASSKEKEIVSITFEKPIFYQLEDGATAWLKFQHLANEWNKQRGASSSISQGAVARPYQEIIGMGPDAVPLILAQLRSEGDNPDQWFWALKSITGEDPTRPEDRGNFVKMAQSWLRWGEQNNVG